KGSRGDRQGNIEATQDVLRGDVEADREPDAPATKRTASEEAAALKKWAAANNRLLPHEDFTSEWEKQGRIMGAEHQVVHDAENSTVQKRKVIWPSESYSDYLTRLEIHNLLPSAPYSLLGFSEAPDKYEKIRFMPVVEQPYIKGRPPTMPEIEENMNKAGCEGKDGWYKDPCTGVIVRDVSEANAIID